MFKTGAGYCYENTKPKGGYGANVQPGTKVGSRNKQATQRPMGKKPSGKHGSAGKPMGKKPSGNGSGRREGNKRNTRMMEPGRAYDEGTTYLSKGVAMKQLLNVGVPAGQSMNKNTIPNGANNTPSVKV